MIFRARLLLASDIRKGHCNIEELDDRRTLQYFGIASGTVLHVAVAPAMADLRRLRPSGPACIPPPRPPRPGLRHGSFSGGAGGGGGNGPGGQGGGAGGSRRGLAWEMRRRRRRRGIWCQVRCGMVEGTRDWGRGREGEVTWQLNSSVHKTHDVSTCICRVLFSRTSSTGA